MANWFGFIIVLLIVLVPMASEKGLAAVVILGFGLCGSIIVGGLNLIIGY